MSNYTAFGQLANRVTVLEKNGTGGGGGSGGGSTNTNPQLVVDTSADGSGIRGAITGKLEANQIPSDIYVWAPPVLPAGVTSVNLSRRNSGSANVTIADLTPIRIVTQVAVMDASEAEIAFTFPGGHVETIKPNESISWFHASGVDGGKNIIVPGILPPVYFAEPDAPPVVVPT